VQRGLPVARNFPWVAGLASFCQQRFKPRFKPV